MATRTLSATAVLIYLRLRQRLRHDDEPTGLWAIGGFMKITVDVDCTPAEARAFLGLPDVTPIHEHYVRTMLEGIDGIGSAEQMEKLFKSFSPLGDAGMRLFGQMMNMGLAGSYGDKASETGR